MSTVVTCVNASQYAQKCPPGQGMKRCPSGSVILASEQCVDLYGVTQKTNAGTAAAVNATTQQQSTIVFTITNLTGTSIASALTNVKSKMDSALQKPEELTTSMAYKVTGSTSGSTSRRLSQTGDVKL